MAIGKRSGGGGKHDTHDEAPAAHRYAHEGDDNWGLRGTACPIGSSKINTQPGNEAVLNQERKVGYPVYDDLDSGNIFHSTTKGK